VPNFDRSSLETDPKMAMDFSSAGTAWIFHVFPGGQPTLRFLP